MTNENYVQYRIIRGETPEAFTEDLNRAVYELRDKKPEVHISETATGMMARISYTERVYIAETVAEQYELDTGFKFRCEDCPLFSYIRKADGTADNRIKYGDCPLAEFGRTYKESAACDRLYELIRNKGVRLCLTESES